MSRKTKDIRLATMIDDIANLGSLFQKCSFCLDIANDNISKSVSTYAVGICVDEEWNNPQGV